ncbi:winged helix-turn-helix domain-containing protein [Piscibacillus salipiscarius]|uniref:Winged helix-turn-helix domain-containing protein n=1 Tax=Piscibacillus salipiscarius TaxID=299480 RepID=A0ABW5QC61_9BACI|nr:winged helix-turn-helix domain-containing protein [Piscibacillus salipiscarius]
MPCGKNETTLAPSQIELFLTAIENSGNVDQIREKVNLPVFKVRSALRELEGAGYIEEVNEEYVLTDKGMASL